MSLRRYVKFFSSFSHHTNIYHEMSTYCSVRVSMSWDMVLADFVILNRLFNTCAKLHASLFLDQWQLTPLIVGIPSTTKLTTAGLLSVMPRAGAPKFTMLRNIWMTIQEVRPLSSNVPLVPTLFDLHHHIAKFQVQRLSWSSQAKMLPKCLRTLVTLQRLEALWRIIWWEISK